MIDNIDNSAALSGESETFSEELDDSPDSTRVAPKEKVHPLGCHRPRVSDRTAMDAIFLALRCCGVAVAGANRNDFKFIWP